MSEHRKIPATIITGFLGSGKTTLLRHILSHAEGRRVAVIVNEFGELGIDGDIIRSFDIGDDSDTRAGALFELANGCLCCTVQEEFYPVMKHLVECRDDVDHILIETSGLALPKPLVRAFNWPEIKHACTVDAVITVVDAPATASGQFAAHPPVTDVQFNTDLHQHPESPLRELFRDQLSTADLVVLSKADLVSKELIAQVEAWVREDIPPEVKVIASDRGRIELNLLLGLDCNTEDSVQQGLSQDASHHDHSQFDSVLISLPVVNKDLLMQSLHHLVQEFTIFRVKGFVALPQKPMRLVVQGVGKRFDTYFDRPWKTGEVAHTHLVLIGQNLNQEALYEELAKAVLQVGSDALTEPAL